MEVTLSVFGTFVRFVDMGSTWVNLLCYPFVAVTSILAAATKVILTVPANLVAT